MSDSNSPSTAKRETEYGKACVFMARLCGILASFIVLLCGLVSLLPLPSFTTSLKDYPRCLGVGFIFIISSVVMFFIEGSVLGHCVDKLSFLLVISKYLKHWQRAVFYMGISIAPLVLWCLSGSTILPMIILFLVGTLNFVLAIGQKGDHSQYLAARWQRLGDEEMNDINEEDEEEEDEEEDESQTTI